MVQSVTFVKILIFHLQWYFWRILGESFVLVFRQFLLHVLWKLLQTSSSAQMDERHLAQHVSNPDGQNAHCKLDHMPQTVFVQIWKCICPDGQSTHVSNFTNSKCLSYKNVFSQTFANIKKFLQIFNTSLLLSTVLHTKYVIYIVYFLFSLTGH